MTFWPVVLLDRTLRRVAGVTLAGVFERVGFRLVDVALVLRNWRVHQSLDGQTPAMAADVTDHVWKLPELIALLEQAEKVPTKRGRSAKTRARRRAVDSN
jgi:hypothetical protein